MASPPSSSSDPGASITVSQAEFNLFHKIDRELFSLIMINLSREPGEAIQVMAFFMWLEKITKDFRMISKLLKWPIPLLDGLVNEVITTLNCIESDKFSYTNNNFDLPLTQSLIRSHVNLQYFHENRLAIIQAITKLINDVCVRAFTDIVQRVQHEKFMKQQGFTIGNFCGPMPGQFMKQAMYYNGTPPGLAVAPQFNEGSSKAWTSYGYDSYDLAYHKEYLNNELTEVLGSLELNDGSDSSCGDRKEVPTDERTIFLTFSKGYPISELEVRDFFSRRYGDIIEAVYMQDVPRMVEQPLYARLVLRSSAMNMIEIVLEGTHGRAKFTINGKHVWARRYIRKSTKSPPASPSATATSN